MNPEELARLQELIKQRARLDEELEKFQRLLTVMFADIVGSTSFFERFGDVSGLVMVHKCIDMLSPVAEQHGGTVCKTIGDAVMTSYEDPVAAVRAAIDMQLCLAAYNEPRTEPDQIHVRIGLNYGPGLIKDKDVFGDVVNVAARIESLAKGEQILISASLEEKARRAKIPCQRIPEVSVKGKAEKLTVYEVIWRQVKSETAVGLRARAPTVAGRTPVAEAAKPASGTIVMPASAVFDVLAPRVQYSLVVIRPDGTPGQACKLEKPVSVLGRVEGDIVFPEDTLISRRHARFFTSEEGLAVEDLNSANGIFWRLRAPHVLQDGDIILMGRQMFRFRGPDSVSGGPSLSAKNTEEKPRDAKPRAELIRLLAGGMEENHYPLEEGENILGRTRGTVTFPEDAYLSSQHARVRYTDGKFILEDLQAVNGTFVGVRNRVTLNDGDIILIGHQLLRITATPA